MKYEHDYYRIIESAERDFKVFFGKFLGDCLWKSGHILSIV